ncbi:unnamed protein product [Acanthosepion pharaonis]|uniref:Uncharacterized protein n=1 Tax=Acanthosepion pharaonis TaxID=158019 RepID=A0A812CUW2_ACAPH|nr:unnamed protein product [Sepia pharaonis]
MKPILFLLCSFLSFFLSPSLSPSNRVWSASSSFLPKGGEVVFSSFAIIPYLLTLEFQVSINSSGNFKYLSILQGISNVCRFFTTPSLPSLSPSVTTHSLHLSLLYLHFSLTTLATFISFLFLYSSYTSPPLLSTLSLLIFSIYTFPLSPTLKFLPLSPSFLKNNSLSLSSASKSPFSPLIENSLSFFNLHLSPLLLFSLPLTLFFSSSSISLSTLATLSPLYYFLFPSLHARLFCSIFLSLSTFFFTLFFLPYSPLSFSLSLIFITLSLFLFLFLFPPPNFYPFFSFSLRRLYQILHFYNHLLPTQENKTHDVCIQLLFIVIACILFDFTSFSLPLFSF